MKYTMSLFILCLGSLIAMVMPLLFEAIPTCSDAAYAIASIVPPGERDAPCVSTL